MTLDHFLAQYEAEIQQIVRQARDLLLERIPNVVETQDAENLGFGLNEGYSGLICVLTPKTKYVNLGIYDAVKLSDPDGLLQGTGKRHRHVKIRSAAELQNPVLWALIDQAIARKTKN